jgi:hypothetical protein
MGKTEAIMYFNKTKVLAMFITMHVVATDGNENDTLAEIYLLQQICA